ncbi:MAG: DNA mismatch repair protein MutS, partial [Alphaproteobacteria bacterium]|nr:DNA mismatch repair protein MutS [Alphaproteobacteria bacterium]
VRAGVDAEVDRERAAAAAAREQLAALEQALREETGIVSLRIGYQRSFGYQIELTRSQAARAPEDWERRQSLRDRERFTEPRLGRIAEALDAAEERLEEAERACVERLRLNLVAEAEAVRSRTGALARLDAATALAGVAAERAWNRPRLEHSGELEIEGGRHPIVEAAAAQGAFVPNDLRLADDGRRAPQLLLVTGPNMAGKSTYLRQAALIVILAQMGSYVPAERARVGLVDRIFARVGAHDELARGRSTFMVEMLETARLLHGATDRSLLLLDEIGRGTSTWDGLAIAQAVAEALAGGELAAGSGPRSRRSERGPRTLFATHFHELTALAGRLPRVANAAVQVDERDGGRIEFLYRVAPGAADRSYGVQVAAQAGLPGEVVVRARHLLEELERRPAATSASEPARNGPVPPQLMLMPPAAHPILHDLAALDVDGITPLEAISALYALRDQAQSELRGLHPERATGAAEAGS